MAHGDRRTQGLAEQIIQRDLYRADEVYYPNHVVRAPVSGTLWRARVKNQGYAPPALPITTDPIWELYAVNSGIDIVALINAELGGTGWQGAGSGSTNLGIGAHDANTLEVTSDAGADVTLPAATETLAGLLTAGDKVKLNNFDELAQDAVGSILSDAADIDWTYDDLTPAITAAIKAGVVTNAKLANMAEATIKGRAVGAGTGSPQDLTSAQATAILDVATTSLKGLLSSTDKSKLDGLTWTFTAAETAPSSPDPGDLWLDTSIGVLFRWHFDGDTGQWVEWAGHGVNPPKYTITDVAPSNPSPGDRWFDTLTGIVFEFINDGNSTQWIETGMGLGGLLQDGQVTFAKMADLAGLSVIGRNVSSPGVVAAITSSTNHHVLRQSGTDIGFGLLVGDSLTDATVPFAKIQNIATARLLGRSTAGSGSVEELAESAVRTILGYLRPDVSSNLTKGMTATEHDNGTVTTGTLTPDPTNGNMQKYTNNGAHTLAPPSAAGSYTIVLDVTNGASAGAITTSSWTKVTGDPLTTTNGHKFRFYISKGSIGTHLNVQAMQ